MWELRAPDLAKHVPNSADGQLVPDTDGLCYLRIWSTAEGADPAGVLVGSVNVRVAS